MPHSVLVKLNKGKLMPQYIGFKIKHRQINAPVYWLN